MPSETVTAWSDGESARFETIIIGIPGSSGTQGEDGMSAYEVAVDNGFEGTEEEWLASLVSDVSQAALDTKADKSGDTFTGPIEVPTADPVENSEVAANTEWVRTHVANSIDGQNPKNPVRFLVDSAVPDLATDFEDGDTFDGLTLATGDRFLRQTLSGNNSTAAVANGIYVVQASGAAVRAADADSGAELKNAVTMVLEGTYADSLWVQDNTTPDVGTDTIIFYRRSSTGAVYTAGDLLALTGNEFNVVTADIPNHVPANTFDTKSDLAASTTANPRMRTLGDANYNDGGAMDWKRVGSEDLTLPAFWRRDDGSGNHYEAIHRNHEFGERIGIHGAGSGVDVGGIINEFFAWAALNGGGRLTLPEGITNSDVDIVMDGNGLVLDGISMGNSQNSDGSQLRLATGKTVKIGGDVSTGGTERYLNTVANLAVLSQSGSTAYFFSSYKIRGLTFQNIQIRGVYGFHKAGDSSNSGNLSKVITYENIEGSLNATTAQHGILAANMGNFDMKNVYISGAANAGAIVSNTAFLHIPPTAANSPDGANMVNVKSSYFDRGIDVQGGISILHVTNSWFDGCKSTGIRLLPSTGYAVNGMYFHNCHLASDGTQTATQDGIQIAEAGGNVSGFEFSGGQILNFGRNAVRLVNAPTDINIHDVQIKNNCNVSGASNTTPAIYIGASAGTGVQVHHNNIRGGAATYGVEIDATATVIDVRDNVIQDTLTGTILNSNRGSLKTRKIYGNTGQVLEGQAVTFGPWSRANLAASLTSDDIDLAGGAGPTAMLHRRARLVGINARGSAALSAGQVTFTVTKNGSNTSLNCSTTSLAQCSAENLDGIAFDAADRFGVHATTTGAYAPTTLDWDVFLTFVYD